MPAEGKAETRITWNLFLLEGRFVGPALLAFLSYLRHPVLLHVLPQIARERLLQRLPRAVAAFQRVAFDLVDRQEVARGRGDEYLVGGFEVGGGQRLLLDVDARQVNLAEQDFARDAGEAARA